MGQKDWGEGCKMSRGGNSLGVKRLRFFSRNFACFQICALGFFLYLEGISISVHKLGHSSPAADVEPQIIWGAFGYLTPSKFKQSLQSGKIIL